MKLLKRLIRRSNREQQEQAVLLENEPGVNQASDPVFSKEGPLITNMTDTQKMKLYRAVDLAG